MADIFFIPNRTDRDNEITQNDISMGILRITKGNKKYFPDQDSDIKVLVRGVEHDCKFRTRDSDGKPRSYSISLGIKLMKELDVKTSDILECEKIGDKKYRLSN